MDDNKPPDEILKIARGIPKEALKEHATALWNIIMPLSNKILLGELEGTEKFLQKLAAEGRFSNAMADGIRFAATAISLRILTLKREKEESIPPELLKTIDSLYEGPDYKN